MKTRKVHRVLLSQALYKYMLKALNSPPKLEDSPDSTETCLLKYQIKFNNKWILEQNVPKQRCAMSCEIKTSWGSCPK